MFELKIELFCQFQLRLNKMAVKASFVFALALMSIIIERYQIFE